MKLHKMIPTPQATGRANEGWKWRKYKCELCPAITTYNLRRRHARNRHRNEYKLVKNLDDMFTLIPLEGEKVVKTTEKVQSTPAVQV